MKIFSRKIILLPILLIIISCNSSVCNLNTVISIKTTLGDIKIKLYDGTPIHRDNFIKLIKTGFYEGVSFHRVIKDFMIQAGDPVSKAGLSTELSDSMKTFTIPSEFTKEYFHKKGALSAARLSDDINPEMRSAGTQFYIVQGVRYSIDELTQIEQRINSQIKQNLFKKILKETTDSVRQSGKTLTDGEIQEIASVKMFMYLTSHEDYKITEEQRNVYINIGGAPRLDGAYTVFGEVIEGLDVVDRIASVKTDINDKPVDEIKIIKIKIFRN